MAVIAVDFDNTLINTDENGVLSPIEGGKSAMENLLKNGHTIVVHSCRTGIAAEGGYLEGEVEFMTATLEKFEIPYSEIFIGLKIVADLYIDDRAINFNGDWGKTISDAHDYLNGFS